MKKLKYPELVGEMAKHGETQKELGKLLGLTYASISRRLSGETKWSTDEADTICKHYKKSYYELFTKEGE